MNSLTLIHYLFLWDWLRYINRERHNHVFLHLFIFLCIQFLFVHPLLKKRIKHVKTFILDNFNLFHYSNFLSAIEKMVQMPATTFAFNLDPTIIIIKRRWSGSKISLLVFHLFRNKKRLLKRRFRFKISKVFRFSVLTLSGLLYF